MVLGQRIIEGIEQSQYRYYDNEYIIHQGERVALVSIG